MATNIVAINRGDTYDLDVFIHDKENPYCRYILKNDDAVYFGLMDPNQCFEDALVKKKYTKEDCDEDGQLKIHFDSEDTLDLFPGRYYYMIKLHQFSESEGIDNVITLINKTKFVIHD